MATKYRKMALDGPVLDPTAVSTQLNHFEYVTIKGSRENVKGRATCTIFLIAPDSKYATKSVDFKKLLSKETTHGNIELAIVTSDDMTTHIKKYIDQFRAQNPNVHFECFTYEKFFAEMPLHCAVPPHQIAPEDEVEAECDRLKTNKENFPNISERETQAVWLGAHRGQVIKIMRQSETVGVISIYRYVTA